MGSDEPASPICGTETRFTSAGGVGWIAGVGFPRGPAAGVGTQVAALRVEGAQRGAPGPGTDGQGAGERRAGGLLLPQEAGREVPPEIGSFVGTLSFHVE